MLREAFNLGKLSQGCCNGKVLAGFEAYNVEAACNNCWHMPLPLAPKWILEVNMFLLDFGNSRPRQP